MAEASSLALEQNQLSWLSSLEQDFSASNIEFARAYYLFATAKLSDTYESGAIYQRYPNLLSEATFHQIKALYDSNPAHEQITRLFTAVLGFYTGNQLSELSDALQNQKNTLMVNTEGLGLTKPDGSPVSQVLYEDVSEWLKKLSDKSKRQALYERMAEAYTTHISPRFIELFHQENALMAKLGYPDIVDFYARTSGHNLNGLGDTAKKLLTETEEAYQALMRPFYFTRTGANFLTDATRADISYVFHGPQSDPDIEAIDRCFPESKLLPMARRTFDRLGLRYSQLAQPVDYKDMTAFECDVVNPRTVSTEEKIDGAYRRILLDVANRTGKRSRAYVYPAQVPSEIYLSVKPEGGLDDYSAFFHESGHALHFAYESPELGYAMAQMGNNTTTESYAYLFQNLFLNRHWLVNEAGLTSAQALKAIQRSALNDLYMLRRYSSKMLFELELYTGDASKGIELVGKDTRYAQLLTDGTGFVYDAGGWTRDVDAGFYVADYFTAWSLEAQLRAYLCDHFGNTANAAVAGEDWYLNPKAGAFLKALWKDGNLPQAELSQRLGYNNPAEVGPLLRFMQRNLPAGDRV